MENCICFCTHIINDNIIKYIEYVKLSSSIFFDFWVLYDNHGKYIDESNYNFNIFQYDSSKIDNFFTLGYDKPGIPYGYLPNPILLLCEFKKEHNYQHYLMMENDIVLYGKLNKFFFNLYKHRNIDFIHIGYDDKRGKHWPKKLIENNPFYDLHFCWQHLEYLSDKILDEYYNMYSENPTIYYEYLVPSIAYNGNYTIRQFENLGYNFNISWGPNDVYENEYINNHHIDTFYHPIKNIDITFENMAFFGNYEK